MTGARNVRGGILLLCAGLLLGLAMSLYAFVPMVPRVPASLDAYDDLPRRLIRLAHIAAIMLPVINIVLGGWIDRLALSARQRETASRLLLWGGAGVPAALLIEAVWPLARNVHLSGVPVLAFCAAVAVLSVGAWRSGPGLVGGHGKLYSLGESPWSSLPSSSSPPPSSSPPI